MKITNEKEYKKAKKELHKWEDFFMEMKKELSKQDFVIYTTIHTIFTKEIEVEMKKYKKQKGFAVPIILAIVYGLTILTKVVYPIVLEKEQKQQTSDQKIEQAIDQSLEQSLKQPIEPNEISNE